jgi:hypothetical protein
MGPVTEQRERTEEGDLIVRYHVVGCSGQIYNWQERFSMLVLKDFRGSEGDLLQAYAAEHEKALRTVATEEAGWLHRHLKGEG